VCVYLVLGSVRVEDTSGHTLIQLFSVDSHDMSIYFKFKFNLIQFKSCHMIAIQFFLGLQFYLFI